MPKRLQEKDLALIVDIVRQRTDGTRRSEIAKALKQVPQRTLQNVEICSAGDQRSIFTY